ncbi:MAG TPA: class I SAM-dependent methyltransferase, partial [Chitinophagaceae bacterium]|nr:class I SAM-dependent methyltransferase [Chitinophagaceae bacterium]
MSPVYLVRKVVDKFSLLPKKKQCNICGSKVFDFLPLPGYYLKNFKKYGFRHTQKGAFETIDTGHFFCPQCYSTDRERLYAWYMKNHVVFAKEESILDFAPSKGFSNWVKLNYDCKYVTADLFIEDMDVKTDIEKMDVFADNSFDLVICSHIMEHVKNDQQAMAEIFRILKRSARAIIMTPVLIDFDGIDEDPSCTDIGERWRRFGQDDHIRLYSQKVFTERLGKAGF